ncbi:hypothetical protein RFY44_01215 [Acinetobacter bereziniae]|uniref:hypothetical protein n=2 Tax=Acinetobacter bereziniae TaxID=106648 RepID=UPI002813A7A4|nr:hypothetical protein [Acinetobacter bereziniae]MDQ9817501.1 hypothetical protein [Acinetobacter bereziniae]
MIDLSKITKEIFSRKEKENNSKFFSNMVREIEYSILLDKEFPNEIFELYEKIFMDGDLMSSRGAYNFMFHLYNDYDKLTKNQIEKLKEIIVIFSKNMEEETLKYVVLDILLNKMTPQDIFDMKELAEKNRLDESSEVVYGINEMARRYF